MRVSTAALITVALFSSEAGAATFYVDNEALGTNEGTSWLDAWQSFADIEWNSLGPGDTLFISGGTESKTYGERLILNDNQGTGVSGAPGNPVLITRGTDPGHDGTVIIDGDFQRLSGVFIWHHSHIVVRGLELRGAIEGSAGDGGGGQIVLRAATSVVIEDCTIEMERARGMLLNGWSSPDGFGDGSGANRSCILRNNTITTPVGEHNFQTDGIYSQYGFDNVFQGIHLIDNNTATDAAHGGSCEACHNDCVQTYRETDASFIGNYCEQNNTKTAHCQGLYSTESFGTFVYTNNVIYYPHSHSSVIGFRLPTDPNSYVYAYHNTLVATETQPFVLETDGTVMNNIFITSEAPAARFNAPISDPSSIDYNIYFNAGGSHQPVYYDTSGSMTWAEWQGAGFEQHGLFIDPELSPDFRPSLGSPAIDAGAEIGEVDVDFDGTPRPQGQGYDIGAFELSMDPDIVVTPLTLDLGSVAVGDTSEPQTISINNVGVGALEVSAITVDGEPVFAVDLDGGGGPCGSLPTTLASSDSCTVAVAFSPSIDGVESGALTIASNDPFAPEIAVSLSGTGLGQGGEGGSGSVATNGGEEEDSGCGCRVAGLEDWRASPLWALLTSLGLVVLRSVRRGARGDRT